MLDISGLGDGLALLGHTKRGEKEQATDLLLTAYQPGFPRHVLERQDDLGDGTALFWACSHGFDDLVDILLTLGAKVNSRTRNGATPLHAAADRGRLSIARRLLEWGSDTSAVTLLGETACHLAAYNGHSDVARLLINAGTDYTFRNWRGNDVLGEARAGSHPRSTRSIAMCIHARNQR